MSTAHAVHAPGAMTPFRARLGEHAARDEVPAIAMPGRTLGYPELVRRVDACAARLVRAGRMIGGYVGDPQATARHFRDGWFHPGDLGRFDRDGRLCLAGRVDVMMNRAGINDHPAEIETVLEAHPAVRAASAYARRSGTFGDIPMADVELLERGAATEDELLALVRRQFGVRAPRQVRIVDELPRNAAGKVVREVAGDRELRA